MYPSVPAIPRQVSGQWSSKGLRNRAGTPARRTLIKGVNDMSTMEERFDRFLLEEMEYVLDHCDRLKLKDFIRTECAKEYERGKQDGLKEGKSK